MFCQLHCFNKCQYCGSKMALYILLSDFTSSVHLLPSSDASSGSPVVGFQSWLFPPKGVLWCYSFYLLIFKCLSARQMEDILAGYRIPRLLSFSLWCDSIVFSCQCCNWEVLGHSDEFFAVCICLLWMRGVDWRMGKQCQPGVTTHNSRRHHSHQFSS